METIGVLDILLPASRTCYRWTNSRLQPRVNARAFSSKCQGAVQSGRDWRDFRFESFIAAIEFMCEIAAPFAVNYSA